MRTQLDLSDIVQSPEFSQQIKITRSRSGVWFQGKYTDLKKTIVTTGVISATDERDINMIPEGDRVQEMKTIHAIIPLYTTRTGKNQSASDVIEVNGEEYKVIRVTNAGDYGYWRAIIGKIGTEG